MDDYIFKNLVFEGGGVKGIAYLGALDVLCEKGILPQIERIGGTSAGAIVATLIGLGYSGEELKNILWTLDFKNFLDNKWGFLGGAKRVVSEYGWYKGDFFRKWIGEFIKEKTGNSETTFADIEILKAKNKNLRSMYFIGTNLSTSFSEIFSFEHTPRVCIADAVRISMSIPLFFAAKRNFRNDVYVDGGMLDNYPVKLFDRMNYVADKEHYSKTEYYDKTNLKLRRKIAPMGPKYVYNKQTLGFRIDSKEKIELFRDGVEPPHRVIDGFFDYTWALINTLIDAQESIHLHSDDWHRTIYIDSIGVGATDFSLSDTKKQKLYDSGIQHTREYFDWYDNDEPKYNK